MIAFTEYAKQVAYSTSNGQEGCRCSGPSPAFILHRQPLRHLVVFGWLSFPQPCVGCPRLSLVWAVLPSALCSQVQDVFREYLKGILNGGPRRKERSVKGSVKALRYNTVIRMVESMLRSGAIWYMGHSMAYMVNMMCWCRWPTDIIAVENAITLARIKREEEWQQVFLPIQYFQVLRVKLFWFILTCNI